MTQQQSDLVWRDNLFVAPDVDLHTWSDPYAPPVVEQVRLLPGLTISVVRDDLLEYGSKIRFLDYLIGHNHETSEITEWVYGSCPATGYAQISLGYLCRRYNKRAVLYMAKRRHLHAYQQRGLALGVEYHWVEMGMLTVTTARARSYAAADRRRMLLPIGLEHPLALASIVKVATGLPVQPSAVWSVGGSGTLNRGLQAAWPDADCHVVSVGHVMTDRERGRATLHRSAYRFDTAVSVEDRPPFPSAPTYDAKAWPVMRAWYSEHSNPVGDVLFWNVGA